MTQTMEKLSTQDKAKLSRETILEWYKAKNREKLEDLKEEVLTLAHIDREKLRGIIIENTKRELEKHKSLTAEQREVQAKQFADELIKAIVAKESIESVMKRYESMMRLGGPDSLKDRWMKNNPGAKIEIQDDDPQYLALRQISDPKAKKEACILLGFIMKIKDLGGRKKAMELFNECMQKDNFDLNKLRSFFSRESVKDKLGFYYGERKILWKAILPRRSKLAPFFWQDKKGVIKKAGGLTENAYAIGIINVTGWWAVDIDETEVIPSSIKSTIKDSAGKEPARQKEFLSLLKAEGYMEGEDVKSALKNVKGDEFLSYASFVDAVPGLKRELIGTDETKKDANRDSGLDAGEEEKVLKALKESQKISESTYKEYVAEELYKWLSKNAVNKFVKLEGRELGLMTHFAGSGAGSYLYRYSSGKNEVYAVRIDGAKVASEHISGRIFIKNNALHSWESFDKANTEKMLSYVSENMTPQEISAELLDYRIKDQAPEKVSSQDKLDVTRGLAGSVFGLKNVEHDNIQTGYIDKLTEKLKETLEAKGMDKDKTQEYADLRASNVKDEIHKIIETDEVLNKACKDDSKVKLEIKIDSNDQVTVRLTDRNLEKKLKRDIDKKSEDDNSPEAVEGGIMKQITGWVEKYAGRFTGLVMVAMEKVFKISDKVKEHAKGTPTYMGAFLSFLGFKSSKDLVTTKRIKEKAFEKLPPANKKSYSLTKKMIFDEDITLKNKKIIIPKGNGFIPGGKMKLLLDSRYPAEFDPDKTGADLKGKKDLKSIFNTLKKSKEQYKDHEITIESGTVVPSKTEIPKGSRIEKV